MWCLLDLGGKPEDAGLSLEASAIHLRETFEGMSPRRTSSRRVKTQDKSLSEVSEIRIGESDVLGTVTAHLSLMGVIRGRAYICIHTHIHVYGNHCIRPLSRYTMTLLITFGVSFLDSRISIMFESSRSLLPRSIEKRPQRLRLEIEIE